MPTTLLSLASRQIWPQVLAVAYLKPQRLLLLHSDDHAESKRPAQRLKRFFENSDLVPKGGTHLELISDSDFASIERRLDEVQTSRQLPLPECVVNFTGGNKLMATAAFRWAAKRGVKAFYLERRNRVTWFEPRDGETLTQGKQLDGHLADTLDPVALLRCQEDPSEVERTGQAVVLNDDGRGIPEKEMFSRILSGDDARRWLKLEGDAGRGTKEGDALEFATAAVLLKLGVHRVQRGLRLKAKSAQGVGTRQPHAEIDLLFTWGGRLWLVDCKDRRPPEDLAHALRRELGSGLSTSASGLLDRIESELETGQTKALKEDLIAVRETGGLLGQTVCVRKADLPDEVLQYAHSNQVEVVQKRELVDRFRHLLFPDRPPDAGQLQGLVDHFRK